MVFLLEETGAGLEDSEEFFSEVGVSEVFPELVELVFAWHPTRVRANNVVNNNFLQWLLQ